MYNAPIKKEMKYVNHLNEILPFGDIVHVNYNDLRNYTWRYDKTNDQISNFSKGIISKKLPFFIFAKDEDAGVDAKNTIFEIFEKDVLAEKPGKLWIGEYYYECYITESAYSDYLVDKRYLKQDVRIISDHPVWMKETDYYFDCTNVSSESFYPYGYPYKYSNNLALESLLNENFSESNFELIIYGPVINPTVNIHGHPYKVNLELLEFEYLTISSRDKTIVKTKVNGETSNEFHYRDKSNSVFKKIPSGENSITWNETFNFTIRLLEERSSPKWT